MRMIVKLPWPYENRDVVFQESVKRISDTTYLHYKAVPNALPKTDLPRIEVTEGHYKLYSSGQTEVWIEYLMMTDPGMSLPAWLIEMKMIDSPVQTLKNLEGELRKKHRE
jgi:hypothetical protein